MNLKVSVVIPIYNAEKYLDKCIKSVINQSYKNIEIILINDGSTDKSLNICKKYKSIDKRIIIINKKNSGVSDTRNIGISKSTGDYITFIDADDWISKNFILEGITIIKEKKLDLIKFSYYKNLKIIKKKYNFSINTKKTYNEHNKIELYNYIFDTNDLNSIWGTLYKKSLFDNILFNKKLKYAEDLLLMYFILKKAKKIMFINKPLYHYRINTESATHNNNYNIIYKKINDNIYVYEYIFKDLNCKKIMYKKDEKIMNIVNEELFYILSLNKKQFNLNINMLKENKDFIKYSPLNFNYKKYLLKKIKIKIKQLLIKFL